jgi:hypothetical protein
VQAKKQNVQLAEKPQSFQRQRPDYLLVFWRGQVVSYRANSRVMSKRLAQVK